METLIRNKFTWLSGRIVIHEQFPDETNLLPDGGNRITDLGTMCNRFKELSVRQEFLSTNATAHKHVVRKQLENIAYENCCSLKAYAKSVNDDELLLQCNHSMSSFTVINDEELRRISRNIHNSAEKLIKILDKFGITTSSQSEFITQINEFEIAIPESVAYKAARRQIREEMKEIIRKMEGIFEIFDLSIVKLRNSAPAFYAAYMNVKKEKINSGRSMTARITVMDSISEKPIRNVKVIMEMIAGTSVDGDDEKPVLLEKKTSDKGSCWIKSTPSARYKVSATHSEFQPYIDEVYIEDDILNRIEIMMKPNIN